MMRSMRNARERVCQSARANSSVTGSPRRRIRPDIVAVFFLSRHAQIVVGFFLSPEVSPGKDLALGYGIRWKVPFFAIWIGVVASSLLCIAWFPGSLRPIGPLAGIVAGGEFVLGGLLYLFLDRTVFRNLGEEIRERDRKLRRFELLRRDLEETRSNLEAKIQDLRSIYEVSTAIAGKLNIEELFRIIPERVMNTMG